MSLLDAPVYNQRSEQTKKAVIFAVPALVLLTAILGVAGFALGHGWFFTNLAAEHKVNNFFSAIEAKDFGRAYAIYTNDSDYAQHADKHKDYPLPRFTEDWSTESPAGGPILAHHVDISKTDGSGTFGTGIIVAVRVDTATAKDKKLFMWYQKSDGTLTEPAPHILQY